MALTVGFLGAGFIAKFHASMLKRCQRDIAFGPVFDLDSNRAGQFATHTGATVVDDVDAVVTGSDAVFVCTWTAAHLDLVRRVCDLGKPVFIEKPLGVDLEQARTLAAVVEASGVVNQVGLVLRFSPAFALVEALLCDGSTVGEVQTVLLRDDQHLPTRGRYGSTWRGDPALAGSGVLLEHSIHDVDLLERLAGPVTTVTARSRNLHGIDGIEDLVVATYDHGAQTVSTLTTVWHDNLARPGNRRLEVHCTDAFVSAEGDWSGPVRSHSSDGDQLWEGPALLDELARRGVTVAHPAAAFVDSILAGKSSVPDVGTARRAHEVVDATYRSAANTSHPTTVT